MFHIGQLVICIKRGPWINDDSGIEIKLPGEVQPVFGTVYTVRTVDADDGREYLRLAEIVNPPVRRGNAEVQYNGCRFRPVDPQRLSIFRKALTPIREKERA